MPHDESWNATQARAIIDAHAALPGAALPILHALQDRFGYIPDPAIPLIADALNVSRADMHGIVSFYHDFRHAPPGRHVLRLCRAEACQSTGAAALATALLDRLGIAWGGTTSDGRLTVLPVYCLGLCVCGPAALLDGEPIGELDEAKLAEIAA
ncbi:MAG TPA: formate dehydrogenase subunit gamma [Acetobacteraceae bacterium]|jgi:formate dehydrogenase subunit gamma